MNTSHSVSKRPLGQTGIQVTPIGLGVMELSHGGNLFGRAFPYISPRDKNAIIKAALDGGINWFDTAELYGSGISEQALSAGLQAAGVRDSEVIIATKWWPIFRTAGNIRQTIDNRLRVLDPYSIDNYMIHNPHSFSSVEAEMNAMADLIEAGKVRSAGVSNFNPDRMRRAHEALRARGHPLALNQVHYSLLHRDIETDGTLDTARELGVTIVAYTPLASGLLSGKYHKDPKLLEGQRSWLKRGIRRRLQATRPLIEAMESMADRHDATVAQVALNWVINFNGDLVVTIPGATKPQQAADDAAAMHFRLADEELALLHELSQRIG